MKKIILGFLFVILTLPCWSDEEARIKKLRPDYAVIVDTNINGKAPDDYITITNKSAVKDLDVDIYAFSKKLNRWHIVAKVHIRELNKKLPVSSYGLEWGDWGWGGQTDDRYLSIETKQIKNFKLQNAISRGDFSITIIEGEPTGEKLYEPPEDFSKWQRTIEQPGITKEKIFDGSVRAIVDNFGNETAAKNVYKNQEEGVIKMKAAWSVQQFKGRSFEGNITIETKNGKYRITFDDFSTLRSGFKMKDFYSGPIDADDYAVMEEIFEDFVDTINSNIAKLTNKSNDW